MRKKVKPVVIINITVCLAAAALLFYFTRLIMDAGCFRVRDIIFKGRSTETFSYLIGKNIFDINLKKEANRLSAFYPNYKKVRLVRIIPDKIYIDFFSREPLARVRLYRDLYVDEESVFFDLPDSRAVLDLPFIYGLDKKIFAIKLGKSYNNPELAGALEIIKEIRQNKALNNFKVKKIDLRPGADTVIFGQLFFPGDNNSRMPGNIQLFSVLEIKMSQENIKLKIGILGSIFNHGKESLKDIKYIDLRFKEPVIKFKNAKK
ncbi:MAG: hypothetical protein ABH882_04185 [Candidatus Omnitrophota bacterium]|nr:hypothetical protein [Candidatus Omnitrophota bacterium]MBU1929520.1 hypothetical protein [Candidatus Omnitrophota bacterium]MBU2035807.1 hypothetical protein [Candidatus Omnitrophota bacterium]MBU2221791.1 hypothetical protein [Candidatus Omnitrophota bacterium]MBU2258250.1 hypothetical protein [Candidatus Omnitrophota bacterium]